ncbi:MAG: alpha/beta fold hydrolase [Candidatus Thorarchaeota archaeon]|jgi:pimeloyl-ACP methyl ester carboxylesterase
MTVHFEELGDPDDGTVIFVHGAGGSSATWYMQLSRLSDRLHIVTIDLNGHGKTPDRNESDITRSYLDDIHEVVTQFEKPVLGGHSMGGALTQLFALDNPNLIRGAILVGTGSRLKVLPLIFEWLENDFESYVNAVGQYMFDESAQESMVSTSKAEVRKCPPEIISRDFRECDRFDVMSLVGEISVPSLILVGENDLMTPVKYSQYMHERINGSVLHILPKAGHSVMLEQFEEFNQILYNWFKEL